MKALIAFLSLAATYLSAISLSKVMFGDAREGFRMLYHWIVPLDFSDSAAEPPESKVSTTGQILYVLGVIFVAAASFYALCSVADV